MIVDCCVVGSQVDGLRERPDHTAVLNGEPVELRYRANYGWSYINWYRRLVNGTSDRDVVDRCSVLPEFSSVYSVIRRSGDHCNLVINSTDTSLTGIYTCYEEFSYVPASANVTIIGQLFDTLLCNFFVRPNANSGIT